MNTERLKKLVNDLTFDRDRLSTSGKQTLDEILQLMNADSTITLKRVFVDDAVDDDDNICAGVVYLEQGQEWQSGDLLEGYWHIGREAAGACGEVYTMMLERSEYVSADDSIPELEKLEAILFEWISDEHDERKVELMQ